MLPLFIVEALDLLCKHRDSVGISKTNPYLHPDKQEMNRDPWQLLKKVGKRHKVSNMDAVKTSGFRKHMATTMMLTPMDINDREKVAKQLGHDMQVHK